MMPLVCKIDVNEALNYDDKDKFYRISHIYKKIFKKDRL